MWLFFSLTHGKQLYLLPGQAGCQLAQAFWPLLAKEKPGSIDFFATRKTSKGEILSALNAEGAKRGGTKRRAGKTSRGEPQQCAYWFHCKVKWIYKGCL